MKVIRLLDSSGDQVIDSVSADYEDSFSLETFEDLISLHATLPGTKCFILARVQSWDHKAPEKPFFSYYNAYHLNKILFQTQLYKGKKLIHRLRVLNPLTNTDIIGNVQYFMIKNVTTVQKSESKQDIDQNHNASLPFMKTAANLKGSLRIQTSSFSKSNFDLPPPSPTVLEAQTIKSAHWTRANAVLAPIDESEDIFEPRPYSAPLTRSPSQKSIKIHTSGVITRFAVPVSVNTEFPPTKLARRRKLSYANSRASSPIEPSMEQWMMMIRDEKTGGYEKIQDPDHVPEMSRYDPSDFITSSGMTSPIFESFDAVLFATDDDFMESSRVRNLFKNNALCVDDATLFQMTPVLETPESESPFSSESSQSDDSRSCVICFPSPSQWRQMSPGMKTFHGLKFYLFGFLFVAGVAAFFIAVARQANR